MTDIPGWALQTIDLDVVDEEELAALVDDACDNDQSFLVVDGAVDSDKPLAAIIPWARYVHMTALALSAKGDSKPADRIAAKVENEIARDVQGDILR